MKFSLFRKPKQQPEPEKPVVTQEEPKQETAVPQEPPKSEAIALQPEPAPQPTIPEPVIPQESVASPVEMQEEKKEVTQPICKTYLKAMPLKELTDIENVKQEVENGNIIILRVTPLANKNIEEVKTAVNQLYEFAESVGGDIARLGEERVVICPKNIRIWREKTAAPTDSMPTAAPTAA
jgi:SepF-like predicted cell division protein (DUF552 family)